MHLTSYGVSLLNAIEVENLTPGGLKFRPLWSSAKNEASEFSEACFEMSIRHAAGGGEVWASSSHYMLLTQIVCSLRNSSLISSQSLMTLSRIHWKIVS